MTARVLGRRAISGGTEERVVALLCDSIMCEQALTFPIKPDFAGTDLQAIIEANVQVERGLTPGWRLDMGKHYCGRHEG